MAITNHIKGAVEKFKAKTGTDMQDHVLNATYLNGLEGTSYVDLISAQTITGTKTFDVAYANVFATGTGAGNYFQCQKFRGEGNASTYYHALDFGYAGHNQWDFFEYGGIYNFYQNTTADGSGKVNLFQISPDGVTSHKPLIAESTLTAKGAFTSSASTTLSSVKNAGILGTDSSGKVYDNSSAYVTYDNASKDIYLGSHGIHSGTRPSSGSATLMGNGYWIQESSVGVSSAVTGGGARTSEMTPDYISVSNRKIILNSSGIKSDAGTFTFDGNPGSVATNEDLKNYQKKGNYVTIDTAQTITGRKTFNSPANVNGQEVATAIFKTSNGGRLIIGKEGPNSGTMLRFDQTAGTTRLQFRASATPGAMVWTQPEKGAKLYFDLTNSAGVSTRTTLDARSGTIARTSDIGNGKITIQKNGTDVGSFTTNQSGSKTINISLAKSDVGLGNVDNTADKDKSVKYASSAGDASNAFKLVSEDKHTEYDWITIHNIFDRISDLERYTKVYSVDTNTTTSSNHGTPINSKFESNVETLSVDMSTNFDSYPTNQCIYADRVGDVTPNELKVGDIIVIDGYLSRYVSDKTTVTTDSSGQARVIRVKFTAINKQYLDRINGKANVGHTHAISEITNLQSTLNGKQATLVSGTNIKTINGNSILGSGNLSISATLPSNSDVTIRTLSFKRGSSYSISGIYTKRITVSVAGSVGSEGKTNFTIDSDYQSSFTSGTWRVTATIVGGGYIDTLAIGVELNNSSAPSGGNVFLKRVLYSDSQTRTYDVDLIMIRLY